ALPVQARVRPTRGHMRDARSPITAGQTPPRPTNATIRRTLITVPARAASSARRLRLHLPTNWPWQQAWKRLFATVCGPPLPATTCPPSRRRRDPRKPARGPPPRDSEVGRSASARSPESPTRPQPLNDVPSVDRG